MISNGRDGTGRMVIGDDVNGRNEKENIAEWD